MAGVLAVALSFAAATSFVTAAGSLAFDRVRTRATGRAFVGVAVGGGLWAAGAAVQLAVAAPNAMWVAGTVAWVGVVTLGVAWPAFVLAYTGHDAWLTPRGLGLLAAAPVGTFIASYVPATQNLVVRNPRVEIVNGATAPVFDPGPLLLAFVAYSAVVNVATLALLARDSYRAGGVRQRRSAALLAAGALPFAVSIASTLDAASFDFTPLAFSVTSVLVGYAILRYDLLDVAPYAERQLVDVLGDGYVVVDQYGTVASANDTAADILDVDLTPGDDATALFSDYPDLDAAVAAGTPTTTELVVHGDDGVGVYEAHVQSFDAAGIDGAVVLFRNTTESRRAEKRAAALLDRTTTAVSILDADGTVTYANPAHERLLGYEPADLRTRNVFDLVHPEDREAVEKSFAAAVRRNETTTVEFRLRTSDDDWRILRATGEPRFDDPFVQGMVVASTDVTTDRRTRTRLQVVNRVLRHDLRNSVNAILGYVDMLADQSEDPAAAEYASVVRTRADDLLELSEKARLVEESARRPERVEIDVADRVATAVRDLRDAHPDATVTLDADCDARAVVTPLIDAAFENVLENAVEHNDQPEPGVAVRVAGDDEFVTVAVADDGPSIPNTDRRAIEAGTETPLEHASGFGLWLANWLTQESGGTLTIADNDPRGNVVTIRLPRVD